MSGESCNNAEYGLDPVNPVTLTSLKTVFGNQTILHRMKVEVRLILEMAQPLLLPAVYLKTIMLTIQIIVKAMVVQLTYNGQAILMN